MKSDMSNSKFAIDFNIIDFSSRYDRAFIETQLFYPDGSSTRHSGTGFSLKLSKGLYRTRVKYLGQTQDSVIAINQETEKKIELVAPKRYSSLPVRSERNTPAYYKTEYLNREQTSKKSVFGIQSECSLFIFIRMKDKTAASTTNENLFSSLYLLDSHGRVVCDFENEDVVNDASLGYARFCGSVAPGYYRLVYGDDTGSREWMPLHILGSNLRWNTEVSIIYKDRPQLSSVTIITPSKDTPAALLEENIDDLDVAIQALSLGIKSTPVALELLNDFLTAEFENPMLGIVGLHLLFLDEPSAHEVVVATLRKLHELWPRSPDVEALHYRACEKGLMPAREDWAFYDIPMLRLGALAMQRVLVEYDQALIGVSPEQLKFFEQFFLHLRSNSLWSLTRLMDQGLDIRKGSGTSIGDTFDWSKLKHFAAPLLDHQYLMDTSDILKVGIWKGAELLDIKIPSFFKPPSDPVSQISSQVGDEESWLRRVVASEVTTMLLQGKGSDLQFAWKDLVKRIALKYELMPRTVRAELIAFLSAKLSRTSAASMLDHPSIRNLIVGQSDAEDD